MAAWWHENFMEWAAGTQIDTIPGTGWSKANIGAACTIENNANFNSGKCLQVDGGDEITLYSGIGPSGLNVVSWNWIKTLNMASQKSGIRFLTAGNVSFRVFWSTNVGQVDTIILEWTNSAGTVAQLFASARQYLTGVKYPCSAQWNDVTGDFTLNLNGEIFSTTQAQFAGNPITMMAFGKMQTAGGSGQSLVGDLYGYSSVPYVGPVEIRGGFPTSNLPLQDWAAVGAANAWDCINNTFTAAPTQYIEGSAAGQVSQFTAPVSAVNVFQIYSGEHQYYAIRTDVSAVDMNGQIGDSVSTVDGATTAPLQAAYQRFHDIYNAVNPNTGVAWVPADLTNLALGYERQT